MNFETLIKYLVWIAFFGIALGGIYLLLRRLGVVG
jgi:hypothetical protein